MSQVLQIVIFFATGGNAHSQFRFKAIPPKWQIIPVSEADSIVIMNEKRFDFAEQNKPENTKQTDEQPHSDKSFYENLPFQGLKNPPKQVLI